VAGRYRVIKKLGAGGMGAVFLAQQIDLGNRPVALKVLSRKLLDDPEFLQRFHDEANSTASIRHPNVVTIYESGQSDDGTPYIAMEYLEGQSLRDALQLRGALPVTECAEILHQAAHGLSAAHKLGIIHRDVKPDNIFLTRGDENEMLVKVVDFGIAKLQEATTHTLTGTVLGTPAYMSPEQASGMPSDQLDARTDIYSLGVVTYEMLTSQAPFHSDTPLGFVRKHLLEEPPAFRTIDPGLPVSTQVEASVMKALAKNREQRYPSALEFTRDFTRAAAVSSQAQPAPELAETKLFKPEAPPTESSTVAESNVQPPQPPTVHQAPNAVATPARPLSKIRTYAVGGAALAIVVALAIGYFYWSGSHKARVNPKDGLAYVWIPSGTFTMGCSAGDTGCLNDEKPPHKVKITRGFWLGQTDVTVGAYKPFAKAIGQSMPPEPDYAGKKLNPAWTLDQMPMVSVSWTEAQAYCVWAGGRLPTEAEWEFAARGGSTEAAYGPADVIAWYHDNSPGGMHEVAKKRANAFGLYDMMGNAFQWIGDYSDEEYYQHSPPEDPAGPEAGQFRGLRGAFWNNPSDYIRVSARFRSEPGNRDCDNGFRCVAYLPDR
jgi:serine/threonine protein kinase